MAIDVNKAHAKYLKRTGEAGQDWLDGIAGTTKDISGNAVKANGKWKNAMQAAIANDTWVKRMGRVTTADIKAAVAKAGSTAYTNGIQTRADKVLKAFTRVMPLISGVADKVRSMPADTPAQRDQRMLANVQGLRAIKGQ